MISGISDRAAFAEIRANGRHVRSSDLRLRYLPADGTAPRVAFAISSKVGNAVVRNRLRRRLRVLLTEQLDTHAVVPLSVGLVIVLPGATRRSFDDLREQVVELMKKIEKSTLKSGSHS